MNWIEEILIICGISLDIFGTMACKGAVVAKLTPRRLIKLCGLVAVWQLAALWLGAFLSELLQLHRKIGHGTLLGEVVAAAILFGLAVRLLRKAWKNEGIPERREEHPLWKPEFLQLAAASFYTLLAGVAFGFVGFNLTAILVMMLCVSVVVVLAGMYTGYRLGFAHKLQAYVAGGVLLLIAGVDVVLRML